MSEQPVPTRLPQPLPTSANHFGVQVRKKDGLLLTRDNYCAVSPKSSFIKGQRHSPEWCAAHRLKCLENFELNMAYFSRLSREKFNTALEGFLKTHKGFQEISSLKDYDKRSGYYLMVLDGYKQVYVGTSSNIKQRVMSHWSKTKEFDRLIFGSPSDSLLSIDSFRALDTTRLYALPDVKTYRLENDFINSFPKEFITNRTKGGVMKGGLMGAITHGKSREFNPH